MTGRHHHEVERLGRELLPNAAGFAEQTEVGAAKLDSAGSLVSERSSDDDDVRTTRSQGACDRTTDPGGATDDRRLSPRQVEAHWFV
jgi:hypothetical protein